MKNLNLILTMAIVFFGVSNAFSQTTETDPAGGVLLSFGGEKGEKFVQENLSKSVDNPGLVYFDESYEPATASDYYYKRVINRLGPDSCSLIDYYQTGEPALVANIFTYFSNCSQGYLQGQAVFYYKNGQKKSIKPYKMGKLQGTVLYYSNNGTEERQEDYENGIWIEKGKFPAPAGSPILGTWKYIEYGSTGLTYGGRVISPPTVKFSLTITYYQNGINETKQEEYSVIREIVKRNWRYIPKDSSSGVVEEYLGKDLTERGNVSWINRNQFEYTVTFAQNSNAIGVKVIFTRQ